MSEQNEGYWFPDGTVQFLVKWSGYKTKTWVNAIDITPDLISHETKSRAGETKDKCWQRTRKYSIGDSYHEWNLAYYVGRPDLWGSSSVRLTGRETNTFDERKMQNKERPIFIKYDEDSYSMLLSFVHFVLEI